MQAFPHFIYSYHVPGEAVTFTAHACLEIKVRIYGIWFHFPYIIIHAMTTKRRTCHTIINSILCTHYTDIFHSPHENLITANKLLVIVNAHIHIIYELVEFWYEALRRVFPYSSGLDIIKSHPCAA